MANASGDEAARIECPAPQTEQTTESTEATTEDKELNKTAPPPCQDPGPGVTDLSRRPRRLAKDFVFGEEHTLAIDFATGAEQPSDKWYQKLVPRFGGAKQTVPSMYDLQVVRLHLPHLLERRNASDTVVQVTPEQVARNYEEAARAGRERDERPAHQQSTG